MTIATGLCQCGCGEPAPIASKTNPRHGWIAGQPVRYVRGHGVRGKRGLSAWETDPVKRAERNARIVALYTEGHLTADVASKVGLTTTTVLRVLRAEGVPINLTRSKPSHRRGVPIGQTETPRLDHHGYVTIIRRDHPNSERTSGRIKMHRLVMSEHLGRPLLPDEQVHHKNGVKTDNRIENLELRVGPHGSKAAVQDQIEWATTILARYAPDRLHPAIEVMAAPGGASPPG